ncbi:MAG: NAD(P)/FAD-dependent oxidoreductase [Vicinamibacterales bacterium]
MVGAGAAGLAAAIFLKRRDPDRQVLLLDGARSPGAKILVSGGARCNVTNTVVTERDFWGGPSTIVRRVLRGLPVRETVAFFADAGIALHEEQDGKLFPDSNRSRDILAALLRMSTQAGVDLRPSHRVTAVARSRVGLDVTTPAGIFTAPEVVLATGGQSLPKSGSDGAGYGIARVLGHSIVPTTPALVPLVLDPAPDDGMHREVSGVAIETALTLWVDGAADITLRGALLWTHFGISGPVVLNVSRHWLRARLEGRHVGLTANFVPDWDYAAAERFWIDEGRARARASVGAALARLVPASLGSTLLSRVRIDSAIQLAHLDRDARRQLTRALTAWPFRVLDSRGYNYAEATAGGVDLREIDPGSMRSRVCPGLFLIGEILDVDGRLGGFNFQWAWSSAYVAARALASR